MAGRAGSRGRRVAVDGPMRTLAVVNPIGVRYTRRTNHPYTHVGFYLDPRDTRGGGIWTLASWSTSAEGARKSAATYARWVGGSQVTVIPVEGGQERRRAGHATAPHRHVHGR